MTKEVWGIPTLEQHLTQVGGTLPDDLHDQIIAQGKAIVPALLDIFNDEELQVADDPEGWAPIHAVDLLVELRAEEAIPSMVEWVTVLDLMSLLFGKLFFGLKAFGEAVVEPALKAYCEEDDPVAQGVLLEILSGLGCRDERIFELLIAQVGCDVMPGANNLADYGDPRARDALHRAFDQYEFSCGSDYTMAGQEVIELRDAIEALGDELTPEEERKFDDVLAQKEKLRKRIEGSSSERTPGEEIPVRIEVKPGRNDPCWCGSGKKYKKCHLDADRATSN